MLKKEDFRRLSTSAQAALRKVALRAIDKGEKQLDVASLIGVTRQTINNWVSKRRRGDKYAVTGKCRGRKTGEKKNNKRNAV